MGAFEKLRNLSWRLIIAAPIHQCARGSARASPWFTGPGPPAGRNTCSRASDPPGASARYPGAGAWLKRLAGVALIGFSVKFALQR